MLQEKGNSKLVKDSSALRVKESQFVFLRLMKVRCSRKFISKELTSWTRIGRWSELRVVRVRHSESIAMLNRGYCEVGGRRVSKGRVAGRGIKFEECEVGVNEGDSYEGTPSCHLEACCSRVPGRAMDVEVFHDDVVNKGVEERIIFGTKFQDSDSI